MCDSGNCISNVYQNILTSADCEIAVGSQPLNIGNAIYPAGCMYTGVSWYFNTSPSTSEIAYNSTKQYCKRWIYFIL